MSQELLKKLALEAIANFLIVDANGKVAYMNEGYRKLLGIVDQPVIGHPVDQVIPNTRMLYILKSGKKEIGKIMNIYDHENEENINVICNRIPLKDQNGQIIGAVAMTTFHEIEDINKLTEEIRQLKKDNKHYLDVIEKLQNSVLQSIVGTSKPIMDIKKTIANYARSNLSILLTGETGVGKEVFANAIHELSNRKLDPFVKINCAAIPKDLLESELFGYEPGSFTGAKKTGKPGKIELADGGTLLLDEIGEMSMDLQSKLLRVLQEKEVERIGGVKPKKVNIRIICSTNKNILGLIREKLFREDLYYRINTIEIQIPPLRDRKDDIPALADFFIKKTNQETGGQTEGIDSEVISLFLKYQWPGNIRELEHTIERLCFLNQHGRININDCEFLVKKIASMNSSDMEERKQENISIEVIGDLQKSKELLERDSIQKTLAKTDGNKAKAARLLGISRQMLYKKLNQYNLMVSKDDNHE